MSNHIRPQRSSHRPVTSIGRACTATRSRANVQAAKKTVHNIAAMSKVEAEAILASPKPTCVRLIRRLDGTIVTENCPRILRPLRTCWRYFLGIAASIFACLIASPQVQSADNDKVIPSLATEHSSNESSRSFRVPVKASTFFSKFAKLSAPQRGMSAVLGVPAARFGNWRGPCSALTAIDPTEGLNPVELVSVNDELNSTRFGYLQEIQKWSGS